LKKNPKEIGVLEKHKTHISLIMDKKSSKIIFKILVYRQNIDAKCALLLFIGGPPIF
jgi:hypothetical protein